MVTMASVAVTASCEVGVNGTTNMPRRFMVAMKPNRLNTSGMNAADSCPMMECARSSIRLNNSSPSDCARPGTTAGRAKASAKKPASAVAATPIHTVELVIDTSRPPTFNGTRVWTSNCFIGSAIGAKAPSSQTSAASGVRTRRVTSSL